MASAGSSRPYEAFRQDQLILRDHLAVDRTALANERTLMSYTRTALAFEIAGASALHFLGGLVTELGGGVLMVAGAFTLAYGVRRYIWYRRRIEAVREATPAADLPGN